MVHSVFEAVGTAVVFLCIDPAVSMIGAVGDVIGNIADTLVAGKEAKEKNFSKTCHYFPARRYIRQKTKCKPHQNKEVIFAGGSKLTYKQKDESSESEKKT